MSEALLNQRLDKDEPPSDFLKGLEEHFASPDRSAAPRCLWSLWADRLSVNAALGAGPALLF